jgi:hypothetical protein
MKRGTGHLRGISPDRLGRGHGPFWDVIDECSAALRADRREHFTERELRRILAALNQSEVPANALGEGEGTSFILIWAGRIRERFRNGWRPGESSPPRREGGSRATIIHQDFSRKDLRGTKP